MVDALKDTSLETWFMLKNLFEKLPSSFFSILSSCSLMGMSSVDVIASPLICFFVIKYGDEIDNKCVLNNREWGIYPVKMGIYPGFIRDEKCTI